MQSRILLDSLAGKSKYIFKGAFQLKFILEKMIFQLKEPSSPFKDIIINQFIV